MGFCVDVFFWTTEREACVLGLWKNRAGFELKHSLACKLRIPT